MDTFGRLPSDVLLLIKEFYETPQIDIEFIYEEDDYTWTNLVKVYLVIKVGTTITKFILLESYEWYDRIKLKIYYTNICNEDILCVIQNIINYIKYNEAWTVDFGTSIELTKDQIILKYDCITTTIQNNEYTKQNLIKAFEKCYVYVENEEYKHL